MIRRDEFNSATKKVLAERVAWCCSFPGCGKLTIGPDSHSNNKSVNLGEAAHICAASPDGPRYDANMDPSQRKDISNGIWLCRAHARLIDTDLEEYSADTLKQWKIIAESKTSKNLKLQENYQSLEATTLISFGFRIIFYARWLKVDGHDWLFEILNFIKGDIIELRTYSSNFESLNRHEKFIIVESQGDARIISNPVKVFLSEKQKNILKLHVDRKFKPTDPNSLGLGFALSDNNDLVARNGDIAIVSGVEFAIQMLSTVLGMAKGEFRFDENAGSLVSSYYNEYKGNLELLSRLIKLEFIRLSLVNILSDQVNDSMPPLHFIKRIEKIVLPTSELKNSRLIATVSLIWGNGKPWSGNVKIYINENKVICT